jgi:hypothetical protein
MNAIVSADTSICVVVYFSSEATSKNSIALVQVYLLYIML